MELPDKAAWVLAALCCHRMRNARLHSQQCYLAALWSFHLAGLYHLAIMSSAKKHKSNP